MSEHAKLKKGALPVSNQFSKILVLDNDAEFLVVLERVLEEEGFNTTTTWDISAAVAMIPSGRFDFVLVGEHPPEISFRDLLESLQGNQRCPIFIVLESDARGPVEEQYLCAIGAYAVIPKSNYKRIIQTVRQFSGITPGEQISASA